MHWQCAPRRLPFSTCSSSRSHAYCLLRPQCFVDELDIGDADVEYSVSRRPEICYSTYTRKGTSQSFAQRPHLMHLAPLEGCILLLPTMLWLPRPALAPCSKAC